VTSQENLLKAISSAADMAAHSINLATLEYWHVHTSNPDKDQPNERNLTSHFLMHLFNLLEKEGLPPSMYFEPRIQGDVLDGLLVLSRSRTCVLVECKHLNAQTPEWSFETDLVKMDRFKEELATRLPGYDFISVILADNWYEQYNHLWDNRESIAAWKKQEFLIRKSTAQNYKWRLLLATHVAANVPAAVAN